jgi:hypothetical protein
MALFGQDRPVAGAVELGAVVGDLLTGGADRRAVAQASGPKRMRENFDAFKALEEARASRAQANARDALTADLVQRALTGDQGALGELGATTMQMASGQPNFGTFTSGVQDVATMEIDRQIRDALAQGNTATARQLSAVKTDKVLPELGAGGDVVFSPVDGSVEITELGASSMDLDEARATQARAAAAKSLRVPEPRQRGLTGEQAAARMAYITQEAARHEAKRGKAWAQAWARNEAAKSGIVIDDFGVDEPAAPNDITEGGGATPTPIANEAEYRALPSGTKFVAPDGSIRVKP